MGFQIVGFRSGKIHKCPQVKAFKVDPSDNNKKEEVPRAPGMDVIDEAYQGELCFRGRSIMMPGCNLKAFLQPQLPTINM